MTTNTPDFVRSEDPVPFASAPPFARFDATPGFHGEARLIDGNELVYLRLSVNEGEYSSVVAN